MIGLSAKRAARLIAGKIREGLIVENWPDILLSGATMAAGVIRKSQMLRQFASYPCQHELALALREIGRVERTLFIIDWVCSMRIRSDVPRYPPFSYD